MDNYEHSHGPVAASNPHWKAETLELPSEQDIDYGGHGTCDHYRVPVKALNIIWGNDPRFWQWIKLSDEGRRSIGFNDAAMLVQVNWIEVTGKRPLKFFTPSSSQTVPAAKFELYYVVKFRMDAFGWHSVPVKFKVRGGSGKEMETKVVLEPYREKPNQWHEIYGGEFEVDKSNTTGFVEFGMYEVESEWWKGSMLLAGIKIKPKAA